MKLIPLLRWNDGFLNLQAHQVVKVIQALSGSGGRTKQGLDAIAPVPVLARPLVLRGEPSARNLRA